MAVNLKESAGITDDMTREKLEMKAAVLWGDLAYEREENRHLKDLIGQMYRSHRRIYDASITLKESASATSRQMAYWHSECTRWGIEVD